jgi:hypothetical protein
MLIYYELDLIVWHLLNEGIVGLGECITIIESNSIKIQMHI